MQPWLARRKAGNVSRLRERRRGGFPRLGFVAIKMGRGSHVVRHRSAKPISAVRFRLAPPVFMRRFSLLLSLEFPVRPSCQRFVNFRLAKLYEPAARLPATATVHDCSLSACPGVNSTQTVVGSKENTSRGTSTNSALFSQVVYFRIARNTSSIDAKQGDHSLQADLLLIAVSKRQITSEWD